MKDELRCSYREHRIAQSTSGDTPKSGLDVLNQDGDSVEVVLARQRVAARRLNQLLGNAASQHVRPPVHPLTENVPTADGHSTGNPLSK